MVTMMAEAYAWRGDWDGIAGESERNSLEAELYRELSPTHVLHGLEVTALGRRRRRDDVLFKLADGRFAQVHLTQKVEADPRWPWTDVFQTFEDWQAVSLVD